MIEQTEYTGEIEGFPEIVVNRMICCMKEQGKYPGKELQVLADRGLVPAFVWVDTKEGHEFWENINRDKDFEYFLDREPIDEYIEAFPDKLKDLMMQRQIDVGNPSDMKVFQEDPASGSCNGGFDWIDTPEGNEFWSQILGSGRIGRQGIFTWEEDLDSIRCKSAKTSGSDEVITTVSDIPRDRSTAKQLQFRGIERHPIYTVSHHIKLAQTLKTHLK